MSEINLQNMTPEQLIELAKKGLEVDRKEEQQEEQQKAAAKVELHVVTSQPVEPVMDATPVGGATSIADLVKYAGGGLVDLPPFGDGMPFRARMKRPSLMMMMKSGKIPNSLMDRANDLFYGSEKKSADTAEDKLESTKELLQIIDVIAEAAFVEPSWEAIKGAGIELTDDQMMAIFNYTQRGVKALEPFREKPQGNANNNAGEMVQYTPQ